MEANHKDFSSLAAAVIAQTSSASATGMPTRVLGRTGERVSIMCLGGWHVGAIEDEAEAVRVMHQAIDEGITFFDTCWDYQDGGSEERIGRGLKMDGRRSKVFLMTKNCERDYAGSKQCLEDSLRRLQTDHVDLWQFHELVYDNDPDWIFEKGGIRAAIEAQQEGKVRYIGFTGHKDPRIHARMLSKPYEWDTAQMPINVLDAQYRSFQQEVMPVCLERNVGVIGMKGLGGGWPEARFLKRTGLSVEECYRYCLSLPVATQVIGVISRAQLEQNIKVGRNLVPMTAEEMDALHERTREIATDGRHELFKSTKLFDGPHHRKQHGFSLAAE